MGRFRALSDVRRRSDPQKIRANNRSSGYQGCVDFDVDPARKKLCTRYLALHDLTFLANGTNPLFIGIPALEGLFWRAPSRTGLARRRGALSSSPRRACSPRRDSFFAICLARARADPERTVFVCENPSVVAAAADRLGRRCRPLLCTEGSPRRR